MVRGGTTRHAVSYIDCLKTLAELPRLEGLWNWLKPLLGSFGGTSEYTMAR